MGDSGALLLGFMLAALSVEGLLKTAASVALLFPLLVLAVPILDTSFVVAKRLKYGQPVYEATARTCTTASSNIGFSQRRAAVYIYGWCAMLAGAALATRFIPFRSARRLAPVADGRGRVDRARRARDVDLHRLPARDREAREPAHPAPRAGSAPGGGSSHRLTV